MGFLRRFFIRLSNFAAASRADQRRLHWKVKLKLRTRVRTSE
jgi:hypothetical protein